MDLNERKRRILQAVIDEYVGTAEPVGSRAISKKQELGLSSATIRNEMADLEEMGYLIQPHTSAGRIPSDEGYRFYVNSLMKRYKLGIEAVEQLQSAMEEKVVELKRIVRHASIMTSKLTDYTAVVTLQEQNTAKIVKIDLVKISKNTVMLVVITHIVKSRALNTELGNDMCALITEVLNRHMSGKSADEITPEMILSVREEIEQRGKINSDVLTVILGCVYEIISAQDNTEIFVNNVNSILKYPEYRDINKARQMFSFLEDTSNLKRLISENKGEGVNVTIGSENKEEALKDCSLVTVNYSIGDKTAGRIGVIGPKRMNYSKVFASLNLISDEIDKILKYYIE